MENTLTIYKRTARGNSELIARQSALGAAANSLLVLIDGIRTRGDVLAVLRRQGLPAEFLDSLHSGGYVEEEPVANAAAAAAAAPAGGDSNNRMSDTEQRAFLYEQLIGAAKAHLGLKSFLFHIKIEKAVSLGELRALVTPMSEAIAKASGMAPANEFLKRMQAVSVA